MRAALFLPLLLIPALAAAQSTIPLDFGSPGERLVFASVAPPETEPENAVLTKESALYLDPPGDGATVYILDRATGKIASRGTKGLKEWTVKPADFRDVARFTVSVEPAKAVRITLKDARRSVARLADSGSAEFFLLRPGRGEATVEYNADGKPKKVTQIVDIAADGTATVALPGVVASSEPSASDSAPKAQGQKPNAPAKGGSAGNVFAYLVGLAVVGGVAYVGLRYYQANKDKMDGQLEKLGVQVPKAPDAPLTAADPAVFTPKAPASPQKIVLDDAAPVPLANAPAAGPISMPAAAPKPAPGGGIWLAQGADRVDIPSGETVVGREAGLGLSLVGESSVSRHHATLLRQGDTVTLTDHGSTNGTFVNGAKVTSPTVLRPGDEVRFGQAAFRFGG